MRKHEVMELMQRYLDEDLSSEEKAALDEYLKQDPESMLVFERLKNLSNDLASLPKVSPPFSIVDSILPELEQLELPSNEEPPAPKYTWFTKVTRSRYFKAGAGAAVAAGVIGLFIFTGGLPKSHPQADEIIRLAEQPDDHVVMNRGMAHDQDNAGAAEKRQALSEKQESFDFDLKIQEIDENHHVDANETDDVDVPLVQPSQLPPAAADPEHSGENELNDVTEFVPEVPDQAEQEQDDFAADSFEEPMTFERAEVQHFLLTDTLQQEEEPFARLTSPNGNCVANVFAQDGKYKVTITDENEVIGYASAWDAADSIEEYGWIDDGTVFEYVLVEEEHRTTVRVHVEQGIETRN